MRAKTERFGRGVKPLPDTYETRDSLISSDGVVEFRDALDGVAGGYDGYFNLFWVVDDRATAFAPGSGKKSLKERGLNSPVLWAHDFWDGLPIGKHLSADEDQRGGRVTVAINEGTQRGAEVMSNLRFGIPHGISFGFDRLADRSAKDADPLDLSVAPDYIKSLPRNEIRIITEYRFWETSPLIFASNPKAKPTSVRSMGVDDLTTFLDALKDGSLDPERRALLEQIVAAHAEAAVAGQNHDTDIPEARRNLDVEYAYAFGEWNQ